MSFTFTLDTDGHDSEARAIVGEESWCEPFGPAGGSAGVAVNERTALQSPALLAGMNVLATDVAALPLKVYRRRADGGRDEARDDPRWELLTLSPDGRRTAIRWRGSLMLHALTGGNGYSEIQRLGRGRPHALHLLDPGSTEPEETAARLVYHLRDVGRTLPHTSVLHVAGLSLDGLVGLNFVRLLRQAIGLDRAAETSAANYFANGSEPGGVIETPQKLNPEAKLRLRDGWEGRHGGPGGRHRVAVLEQGASWKATGTDPDKSQLLETRKHQVLDVIRAWRVPPHKAGDLSQAHLANLEASNLDYLMTALVGWLEAIEQEFNLKLFSRSERAAGLYCEHDVNALLRGDIKSRMAAYSTGLRDGWTNRNEVRRRENLNPIPAEEGGDTYTVQAQMIPLRDVGKDRTIPAQAPQSEPNPAEGV